MVSEEWRPVPGWPHEVSNTGRVRSMAGRLLKSRVMERGYHYVTLVDKNRRADWRLHRLVLHVFVGPCPEGFVACHNDGNKDNNAVDNLRYDSQMNNLLDQYRHGTARVGSRHGLSKLTEDDVKVIKQKLAQGFRSGELAAMFGVHLTNIQHIKKGRSWKHV